MLAERPPQTHQTLEMLCSRLSIESLQHASRQASLRKILVGLLAGHEMLIIAAIMMDLKAYVKLSWKALADPAGGHNDLRS